MNHLAGKAAQNSEDNGLAIFTKLKTKQITFSFMLLVGP